MTVTPTRAELAARAAEMRERGYSVIQVAADLGVSRSWASELVADPDGAKRARRRARYEGACVDCGATTKSDGTSRASERCPDCANKKYWTPERIVDAIQRFAAIHGRPPTVAEWRSADPVNGYPSANVVVQHSPFAGWADAIEAAGLVRPRSGKRRDDDRPLIARAVLEWIRTQPTVRYRDVAARFATEGGTNAAGKYLSWWSARGYVERVGRGVYRATGKRYRDERERAAA